MLRIGLGLGVQRPTAWWPQAAVFAADFANNRYMRAGLDVAPAAAFGLTRASEKWAVDAAGNWQRFAAGEPARTDLGVSLEAAAENGSPNAALVGAAVSASNLLDGLPAGWGSNRFDGSAINGQVLAIGTWMGLPSMTLRLWGNSTLKDVEVQDQAVADDAVVAQGDKVLTSLFVERVAGSMTNVLTRLRITERLANGTYVNKQTQNFVAGAAQRVAAQFTIANATTTRVVSGLELALSGAFDITLRIAAPQRVKTAEAAPSSPVLTTGTRASRAADAMVLHLPPGAFEVTLTLGDGSETVMSGVGGDVAVDPGLLGGKPVVRVVAE